MQLFTPTGDTETMRKSRLRFTHIPCLVRQVVASSNDFAASDYHTPVQHKSDKPSGNLAVGDEFRHWRSRRHQLIVCDVVQPRSGQGR